MSTIGSVLRYRDTCQSVLEDRQLQLLPSYSRVIDIQQTCSSSVYSDRQEELQMLMPGMSQRRPSTLDIIFQSHVDPYSTFSLVPEKGYHQIHLGSSDDMLLPLNQQLPWDTSIEGTLKAIHDAIETCYGESFAEWDAFMHDALVNGNVPVI